MHSSSPAGQAHVGVDDDFLACGYAARDQFGDDRNSAFDQGQRDRAQLVMAGGGADEAHGGAIELHRIAVRRQALSGTVEVQHDQGPVQSTVTLAWAGLTPLSRGHADGCGEPIVAAGPGAAPESCGRLTQRVRGAMRRSTRARDAAAYSPSSSGRA